MWKGILFKNWIQQSFNIKMHAKWMIKHTTILFKEDLYSILHCWYCHNKTPQTGSSTKEIYFLTVLEGRNPKWSCEHGQYLVRALFLTLRMVSFSRCPFLVREGKKESKFSVSPIKARIPLQWHHSHDFIYIYFPKAPSPNTIIWEIIASTYEFGGRG